MDKSRELPKGLYDVVSQLVTFIDDADCTRKEKKEKETKEYIDSLTKNRNSKLI